MSTKVSRGAVVLQRGWWFSMFTRNWHSGQIRFPRYQSAYALAGLRCRSRVTSSSSLGCGSGQSQFVAWRRLLHPRVTRGKNKKDTRRKVAER